MENFSEGVDRQYEKRMMNDDKYGCDNETKNQSTSP